MRRFWRDGAIIGCGLSTFLVLGIAALLVVLGAGVVVIGSVLEEPYEGPGSNSRLPAEKPLPPAPAGWRFTSAQTLQFATPAHWKSRDSLCGMDGPTVAADDEATCDPKEKAPKEEWALLANGPVEIPGSVPTRPVELGGVQAIRAEAKLADGRHAGWISVGTVPAAVSVRASSKKAVQDILDTVSVVEDIDANGCPLDYADLPLVPSAGPRSIPENPRSIAICDYRDSEFGGSTLLTGSEAKALADDINKTRAHEPCEANDWGELGLVIKDESGRRSTAYVRRGGVYGESAPWTCLDTGKGKIDLPGRLRRELF